MRSFILVLLVASFGATGDVFGQSETTGLAKVLSFPDKLANNLQDQQQKLAGKLERQTEKYLNKLLRQEKRIRNKISSKDSLLATELQLGSDSVYTEWKQVLSGDKQVLAKIPEQYSGKLDSMNMAIQFLGKQPLLSKLSGNQLHYLKDRYQGIGGQINQAEYLKKLVEDRKALLKEKLSQLGFSKQLGKYSKQAHYYQQQLMEYRQALENPMIMEKKALEILSQVPAFRKYFDKFSVLGSMFRLPGQVEDMDPTTLLNGLQTRSSVMADLINRFGGLPNTQQAMTAGFQDGQQQLSALKDKLANALNKGESVDMPGFKPNQQKTKTFFKRLEPGFNLQSTRANNILPVTSDLGLSMGYKINNNSVVGVGVAYKVGWGRDIRHIAISHEGVGLRTYIDYRIKNSFWLTGGAEWNYHSRFQDVSIFKTINAWQQSALFGIQKKQKFGKYKATASLLYDALWNKQIPNGQPVKFRIAYTK